MTIDQFGIHLGAFFYLHFYALILWTGFLAGGYLASLDARRRGINPVLVWDGFWWALLGGIVGARLWHILTPPPSMVAAGLTTQYYFSHPLDAIAVWNGGLGIPGAVAGGLLGLYLFTRGSTVGIESNKLTRTGVLYLFLFTRRPKLNFATWVDITAPALALGQAIGRWGNYVNQELYGRPTTLPWAINIGAQYRVPGYTDPALRFHPIFLYESIGNLLICLALLYLARRYAERLKPGDLFITYLILYPALRFGLEFLRLDSSQFTASALNFSINANQTLMAIVGVIAVFWFSSRHRKVRRHQLKTLATSKP